MFNQKYLGCVGLLLLAGCNPLQTRPEPATLQVPANPFAEPRKPAITLVNYATASQETSFRVLKLKDELVGKNPQFGLKPYAIAIGSPELEVFHVGNTLYITEGLARKCGTDQALAAVLAYEMGRMIADREGSVADEIRQPEPLLPSRLPIGGGGDTSDTDPLYRIDLIRHEKQYPKRQAKLPRPNPQNVARAMLEKAGYQRTDLDAVLPVLASAERASVVESQFKAPLKQSDWKAP